MREHPIPQDITGYKFHLIGSMTLKQFAEILAGCIIAFIIYKTNLPSIIRWPAAFLFAGVGFMAAFVPIEERPLDHWIITFIKVLFRPTKFFWSKEPKIPEAFTYEPSDQTTQFEPEVDLSPARKRKIYQYLQSINNPREELDAYDTLEQQRINQLTADFGQIKVAQDNGVEKEKTKPNLKVRVRDMKNLSVPTNNQALPPQNNNRLQAAASPHRPTKNFPIQEQSIKNQKGNSAPDELQTGANDGEKRLENQVDEEKNSTNEERSSSFIKEEESPKTIVNMLPPPPNSLPNQISGVIMSGTNELLGNAVIEIKDPGGKTITAVQSNSLGQFVVTRQLPNGEYKLFISAANHRFEPIDVSLKGEIMGALEIKAS